MFTERKKHEIWNEKTQHQKESESPHNREAQEVVKEGCYSRLWKKGKGMDQKSQESLV